MTKDAAFWDRFAPRYARMALRNPEAHEQTLEEVRAHLLPQDHVLEHGCGTGSTALRLAGDVAAYTAADFSQGMIDIAEDKRRAAGAATLTFLTAGIDDPRRLAGRLWSPGAGDARYDRVIDGSAAPRLRAARECPPAAP